MKVRRGDIVLVDYPFSDRTGSKIRPALVVQTDFLNAKIDDTILAAISRSGHEGSHTQVRVDIATAEGAATHLRQSSTIQCENLLTFDQRLVVLTIGRLTPGLQQHVDVCLKKALGIDG